MALKFFSSLLDFAPERPACAPTQGFVASDSLNFCICCQDLRRILGNSAGFTASANSTGGNPAVPSNEFISARFSIRNRATSPSSIPTYRVVNALFKISNMIRLVSILNRGCYFIVSLLRYFLLLPNFCGPNCLFASACNLC
jgi:hypothetical protein